MSTRRATTAMIQHGSEPWRLGASQLKLLYRRVDRPERTGGRHHQAAREPASRSLMVLPISIN